MSPDPFDFTAPTKRRNATTFGEWYGAKLGRLPLIIQAVAWLFYGFLWIPCWWLCTGSKFHGEKERAAQIKMDRLYVNGNPYVEGKIVRLAGVNGLSIGECSILFENESVVLQLPLSTKKVIPYEDIVALQVGGEGLMEKSVNAGIMGGGFGVGGALEGMFIAELANATVSSLTRTQYYDCVIEMTWKDGHLVLHNREYSPESVGAALAPVFRRISSR